MLDNLDENTNGCKEYIIKQTKICAPIEISPHVSLAPGQSISVACSGKPELGMGYPCEDSFSQTCKFTVTQEVNISIPMRFSAKAEIENASIACSLEQ